MSFEEAKWRATAKQRLGLRSKTNKLSRFATRFTWYYLLSSFNLKKKVLTHI